MLGNRLARELAERFEIIGTVRRSVTTEPSERAASVRLIGAVDALDLGSVLSAIEAHSPTVVFNCIGIVKQRDEAKDPIVSIKVNSLFPHELARETEARGIRLVHFSTDCVFSGASGPYDENSIPDPVDLYGRSKLLGEIAAGKAVTIRTSIIGHSLSGNRSLIDWFLSQRGGKVKGYAEALYTGLTTGVIAELCGRLIDEWRDIKGLWHVSAEPINKYALLRLVNDTYGLDVEIEEDHVFRCDRRLDSSQFREATGWCPPSWPEMIAAMHEDWRAARMPLPQQNQRVG